MKFRKLMMLLFVLSAVALISAACNNKTDLPTNAQVASPTGTSLGPCGIAGPAFAGKWQTYAYPYSVVVSPKNGHVYVGEYGGYFEEFTATGTFVNRWYNGSDYYPVGLAVSPATGNFYVVDYDYGFFIYDPTGKQIFHSTSFTFGGVTYSGWYPYDIKLLPNGNFIIADGDSSDRLVEIIDPNGRVLQIFGGVGQPEVYPYTVAVNPNGNIYLWDWDVNSMSEYDGTGKLLKNFSSYNSTTGSTEPCGSIYYTYGSFFSRGVLMVPDYYNHWINNYTADGVFIGRWGGQGSNNGQFYYPWAITASNDGTIYVVDADNYRIQMFRP